MWKTLIAAGIDLEPPVSLHSNVYLGCDQELTPDPRLVAVKGEMFHRLCLSRASGKPDPVQEGNPLKDPTPDTKSSRSKKNKKKKNNICSTADAGVKQTNVKMYAYEMFGHVQQTVDRYLELAKKSKDSLTKVAPPPLYIDDHQIPPEEFEVNGELSPTAARLVLKALYVARIGRMDFMWAVNMLAREVTRWTAACHRRLHRLPSQCIRTSANVLRR